MQRKKNKQDKQSVAVYVRITPNEAKKLRGYARQYKMSLAEALRSCAAEKIFYSGEIAAL